MNRRMKETAALNQTKERHSSNHQSESTRGKGEVNRLRRVDPEWAKRNRLFGEPISPRPASLASVQGRDGTTSEVSRKEDVGERNPSPEDALEHREDP